jgi:uncharacterized protein (TIGR00730 family)
LPVTRVRRLCVFCSSSDRVPEAFREDARTLADAMADAGISLVYGGGSIGLMGTLADRLLARGGRVVGVIPRFLADKELAHGGLAELVVTETMHERKTEMSRRADAFAVLPGGFGTMEEFFEVLTWKQLRLHDRPVVVANTGGWFDPLLDWFARAVELKMVKRGNLGMLTVVPDAGGIVGALRRLRPKAAAPSALERT